MLIRGIGEVRVWFGSCKVWRKSDVTRLRLLGFAENASYWRSYEISSYLGRNGLLFGNR